MVQTLVFNGFLRSKVFKGTLFSDYGQLPAVAENIHKRRGRNIYLVGIAKRSAVLTRYRLALKLKHILRGRYPCYVRVPRELEQNAYVWSEYARGREETGERGEASKFVNGTMFFVKFGDRPGPVAEVVEIQSGVISGLCNEPDSTLKRRGRLHHGEA
jgi:hypothetical protein